MANMDDETLRQLCDHLEQIERRGNLSDAERNALRTAGFALHVVHFHRLMDEVDQFMNPQELTAEQKARLLSIGIDPDAE